MRTGNRRSASIIISFELAAIMFLVRSLDDGTAASPCTAAWACPEMTLCSRHVWPRPSLLRCQRDQARLLDPAAPADPQHRAQLERGTSDPLPVVHYDARAGERSFDVMRWGLVPFWAKDIKVGFANFNAKAEGIETKPAFREAFARRR